MLGVCPEIVVGQKDSIMNDNLCAESTTAAGRLHWAELHDPRHFPVLAAVLGASRPSPMGNEILRVLAAFKRCSNETTEAGDAGLR